MRWALLLVLLSLSGAGGLPAAGAVQDPPDLPEYVLKAGLLYNFAKYVEWPEAAFEKPDSPLVVGIVGADPFGPRIDAAFKDKTVKNRRLEIRRYADAGALERCHLVFVPRSDADRLPALLEKVRDWPVLTVGETEAFPAGGGMVGILVENRKPRLLVNPQAAERARLVIDSKLLRVSTIVKGER